MCAAAPRDVHEAPPTGCALHHKVVCGRVNALVCVPLPTGDDSSGFAQRGPQRVLRRGIRAAITRMLFRGIVDSSLRLRFVTRHYGLK